MSGFKHVLLPIKIGSLEIKGRVVVSLQGGMGLIIGKAPGGRLFQNARQWSRRLGSMTQH